ncbi:sensor domain-containing diguanylate cyclase [Deinococcus radiotolerans]|uniref:Diguanylate cyclase n=1 Tax=Deinococcus radiotolerans TaxID=1309407 RepID=A0ABQ2FMH9_9DEIO|nr:sensor domain-containing diguanylate cyclase [Deinococcus radiotolerans]GGL08360.1 hypothetical protein GCM10010844_28940 [Deinococcus radiotolerans]
MTPADLTHRLRRLGLQGPPATLDDPQGLLRQLEQTVQLLEDATETLTAVQVAYDHTASLLAVLSVDGRLLNVNRAALDLIQAAREDLIGQPFWTTPWWRSSPAAQQQLQQDIGRAAGGAVISGVLHLHLADRTVTVEYHLIPVRRQGQFTGLLVEGRNVTEHARLVETLHQERAFLNAVLDHMQDGVVACDAHGTLTVFNRATQDMHGLPQRPLSPEDWSGAYDLFQADGHTPLRPEQIPLYRALHGEAVQDSLMVIRPAARAPLLISASGQPLRGEDGSLLGAAVVMRDVTDEQASRAQLEHAATHDALTGLLNRAALTGALHSSQKPGRHRDVAALLFLDLDGFKSINDAHGHHVGDEVLQVVARRLTSNLYGGDLVARLGGDEFVAVLAGPCTATQAQMAAERVLAGLRAPVMSSAGTLHLSASIGLVTDLRGASPDELLDRADRVMYQAKKAGKNRVVPEEP